MSPAILCCCETSGCACQRSAPGRLVCDGCRNGRHVDPQGILLCRSVTCREQGTHATHEVRFKTGPPAVACEPCALIWERNHVEVRVLSPDEYRGSGIETSTTKES